MSQSCSGKCQTSFLNAPKWAVILYTVSNYDQILFKLYGAYSRSIWCAYACPGNAPWEILQTLPTALFSPVSSRLLIINLNKIQKNFGSIHVSFRKWFSNRIAPTRAYIDEPRSRRRSSSLAGKIVHLSYPCLIIIIMKQTNNINNLQK